MNIELHVILKCNKTELSQFAPVLAHKCGLETTSIIAAAKK